MAAYSASGFATKWNSSKSLIIQIIIFSFLFYTVIFINMKKVVLFSYGLWCYAILPSSKTANL